MNDQQTSEANLSNPTFSARQTVRIALFIIASLAVFLFAIELMEASLRSESSSLQTLLKLTGNPFEGFALGLLVTAIIQSSSTTTSLAVAMVAAGSLQLTAAVPVIMGANVGTTITSSLTSLGFLTRKKEFRRAVAAGTYHCFFNLLTALLLFPLEYYYGFLSNLSTAIQNLFLSPKVSHTQGLQSLSWIEKISTSISTAVGNGVVVFLIAFVILLCSILVFRKLISDLLDAKSPEGFSRFIFGGDVRAFGWGFLTTAAIRSSTITTSVVVPIAAKKVVGLNRVAVFIMGANLGTTVTAFVAAVFSSNTSSVGIAIAHFLFNFIGVLLFFPIPALRQVPVRMAKTFGKTTARHRLIGFAFILLTFFLIPFGFIYLNQS